MDNINEIKKLIKNAKAVLISAGAGMGVDSGLPDFRGNEGFWNAYPKAKELGLSFEDMANPQWFESDPSLAWAFYGHRLNLYRQTIPHEGFFMLLDLVKQKNENYFIYTSNVDGQFQKTLFDENKIVECHGSIHHLQCCKDCSDKIWTNKENIEVDFEKFEAKEFPKCPTCKKIARPNILMFWDNFFNPKRTSSQQQNFNKWLSKVKRAKQSLVIIEIGAGTAIPTIRNLGERISKTYEYAKLIRINPREDECDERCGFGLKYGGFEGLEKILL